MFAQERCESRGGYAGKDNLFHSLTPIDGFIEIELCI